MSVGDAHASILSPIRHRVGTLEPKPSSEGLIVNKFVSFAAAVTLALAGATAAAALPVNTDFADGGLQEIESEFGRISWSIDGSADVGHVAGETVPIQVEKPEGAIVRKAIFISGDGGNRNSNDRPPLDLELNGGSVVFTHWAYLTAGDRFNTYYGDVTELVKTTIDEHAAGIFDLTFDQGDNADGDYVEGGSLIVIFDDPNAELSSIYLQAGTSDPAGDSFSFDFDALTLDKLANPMILSIGASNSYQTDAPDDGEGGSGVNQHSNITVNGNVISDSAGGCDDMVDYPVGCNSMGYNTIGGVGDDLDMPTVPWTNPPGYFAEDELYDIASMMTVGDTGLTVETINPSNDDNLYFAGVYLTGILPSDTYCTENPDVCFPEGDPALWDDASENAGGGLASTGAEGVDFMTYLGAGLVLAGVAVVGYRIVSRRKSKAGLAE